MFRLQRRRAAARGERVRAVTDRGYPRIYDGRDDSPARGSRARPARSRVMVGWTRLIVAHRRTVLALWFVLFLAGVAGAANVGKLLTNRFSVPGSESERGLQVLRARFHERGDGAFTLVVQARTGSVNLAATEAAAERGARAIPGGKANLARL